MATKTTYDYFPALTGLRWPLGTIIYIAHYNRFEAGSFLQHLFAGAGVALSLFFILSGFLITYKYQQHFRLEKKWMAAYLFKRFARIYPVFFTVSIVVLAINLVFFPQSVDYKALPLHFLMINGYFEHSFSVLIAPSWSLTVEETYYLLAPLLFLLHKKLPVLIIFAILFTTGLSITWISARLGSNDFMHTVTYMMDRTFFGRSLEFLLGMALSNFYEKHRQLKFRHITYVSLVLLLLFMFLQGGLFRGYFQSPAIYWLIKFRNYIFPWIGVAFLYGLLTEDTRFRRLLSIPFIQLLGKISYVFYLIHLTAIIPVLLYFLPPNAVLFYIVLQLLSLVIYLVWEHPAHRFLLRKFGSKP